MSWLHPCKVRRVTVIGDAGMAVYDDTNPAEMLKIYNKGADVHADPTISYRFGEITILHSDWIEPLRLESEDFARAIRLGVQPRTNGRAGLAVVQVRASAQQALEKQLMELVQGLPCSPPERSLGRWRAEYRRSEIMAHILFISPYYPPEPGAAPACVGETAIRLVQRGHQVTVLTTFPNYPTGIVPPE